MAPVMNLVGADGNRSRVLTSGRRDSYPQHHGINTKCGPSQFGRAERTATKITNLVFMRFCVFLRVLNVHATADSNNSVPHC